MAEFGSTTEKRPRRVDDLIDSKLMAKLDQVDVMSRKIFAGKLQGERRSKRRGVSVEFADYRHYVHGDDLRFVDWNVYAMVRHPMYLGILLVYLGLAVATLSLASLALLPAFFYAYDRFAAYEERELVEVLGGDYLGYMGRVRRWVPF